MGHEPCLTNPGLFIRALKEIKLDTRVRWLEKIARLSPNIERNIVVLSILSLSQNGKDEVRKS